MIVVLLSGWRGWYLLSRFLIIAKVVESDNSSNLALVSEKYNDNISAESTVAFILFISLVTLLLGGSVRSIMVEFMV